MPFPLLPNRVFLRSCMRYIYSSLLVVLRIQMVLFLITLPILSSWGLPFSYATVVGNLLFAPIATIFLGLSTLWFVSYGIGLPTGWITAALECITAYWLKALALGSPRFLFAIPQAHPLILILIPISVLLVLYSPIRKKYGSGYELILLMTLALGWCFGIHWGACTRSPVPITQWGGTLWLQPTKEGVDLVDTEGKLRNMSTLSLWIRFSLGPTLAKHFGLCSCDNIVINKPTFHRLSAAAQLINEGKGRAIIVPEWIFKTSWFKKWQTQFPTITVKTA
jgi:hypothetical protein